MRKPLMFIARIIAWMWLAIERFADRWGFELAMFKLLMFIAWIWLAATFFPMIWPAAWPELSWWLIAIGAAGMWWTVWEEHFQKTGLEARSKFPPAGWQPREPRPSRKSRHE